MQLIISQKKFPMFPRKKDPVLSRFHLSSQNRKRKPAINSSAAQKEFLNFFGPQQDIKNWRTKGAKRAGLWPSPVNWPTGSPQIESRAMQIH